MEQRCRNRRITSGQLEAFCQFLRDGEHGTATIVKYQRDVGAFAGWLDRREVDKETVRAWKTHLVAQGYAPVTVNAMLAALNSFLRFAGWEECRVKFLRIQRRVFRDRTRHLSREEYQRLLDTAAVQGKKRLGLLMETICATGIRVSEVRYITVESAAAGRAEVALKGKVRTILIPAKLARKLEKYAKQQKIASGEIFLTRSGRRLSRGQIWAEMKALCRDAGVEASKVFPHNLRHLFATTFYRAYRDIVKLADVLGHSSIETTRIYLVTPEDEHAKQMDLLGLVS